MTAGTMLMAEDPAAIPFWRNPADAVGGQRRVRLRMLRLAGRGQVLQRDWLRDDPILRELANFRMAQGTNFAVSPAQATRLNALWEKIGQEDAQEQEFEREVNRTHLTPPCRSRRSS